MGREDLTAVPLRPAPLGDLVQERLLRDVVSGRFVPGQRLNLDAVAAEYGVSRTPVREALQALAQMGFVEVARNARTAVARWSAEDMRQRAVVITRLMRFIASAPEQLEDSLAVLPLDAAESHVLIYLDVVEHCVGANLPRLSGFLQRVVVAPLRLFATVEVMSAHGVDLGAAEEAGALLADAVGAVAAGDLLSAAHALNSYGDAFVTVLTLSGSGIGSGSRVQRSPEAALV
ncbi:GntR family transcriptional regulator [Microbacterium sp. NPDC089695]|uniref:GntR family transcriptional regulator n=1 Tax=Microbacterium sp. NPDC089695 TaxID=3364198 RepID=UPI0038231A9F